MPNLVRDLWRKARCHIFHRKYWRATMATGGHPARVILGYTCTLCSRHWNRREEIL